MLIQCRKRIKNNNGQLINEISISLINISEIDELALMKYLHTRMPEVKIELNKDLILNE